ncbi:MAG TPA: hypothetical protein VF849_01390 [Blattabacteriaceae bacterium]
MIIVVSNQWKFPITDFDLFSFGISYFGRYDYLKIYWSIHLIIFGFILIIKKTLK